MYPPQWLSPFEFPPLTGSNLRHNLVICRYRSESLASAPRGADRSGASSLRLAGCAPHTPLRLSHGVSPSGSSQTGFVTCVNTFHRSVIRFFTFFDQTSFLVPSGSLRLVRDRLRVMSLLREGSCTASAPRRHLSPESRMSVTARISNTWLQKSCTKVWS